MNIVAAALSQKARHYKTVIDASLNWTGSSGYLRVERRRARAESRAPYNRTRRSRNALLTTDTELSAMAAPANIGDKSRPNTG